MATAERPLRVDAERNRRRILDAAHEAFAAHGLGVGVEAIARGAGVGVGTIYRRFPTKDHLLRAIVEDRITAVVARLEEHDGDGDPWEGLAAAIGVLAESVASDRAFFEVLQQAETEGPVAPAARARLIAALDARLARAQAAGVARPDVVAADIPVLCVIAARLPARRLQRQPDLWRRYLGLVLDSLRAEGARPLGHAPPEGP